MASTKNELKCPRTFLTKISWSPSILKVIDRIDQTKELCSPLSIPLVNDDKKIMKVIKI